MPLPRDIPAQPERRVVRQLCEAMLYEGLVDHVVRPAGANHYFEWTGHLPIRCRGRIGAFGRIRLDAESPVTLDKGAWRPARLDDLLSSLTHDDQRIAQLALELGRTQEFVRWNRDNIAPRNRRCVPYALLDSALDEGHPYHPCFKARTGFSFEDHAAFGPEAGNAFQLGWLAVARERLHQALPEPEDAFWRCELGDATADELRRRKGECGAGEFGMVPVHPWQWRSLQAGPFAGWLADGSAHFLGFAGDRYAASQSVRTLFNRDRPDRANVKLPMNVINSSVARTLEPQSVCAAPAVSDWLRTIIAGDPVFAGHRVHLLGEYAGIIADRDGPLGGQLAAIWRENATHRLRSGEAAVPLNALMCIEADGRPFIADWIDRHGLDRWVERLIDVIVLPVFHLLLRHGVATEAHGQNLILVHHDGWPTALAMQDFHDSVEYVPSFLGDPAGVPDFRAIDPAYARAEPNQFYWMTDVALLGELFVDALFVYNLAEISHLLEHAYGLEEAVFWRSVRERLVDHARALGLLDRLSALNIFNPDFHTESLLTRKLRAGAQACSHRIPNSLAVAAGIRRTA